MSDTFRDYLDNKLGSIDSHVSELIPDTAELRSMRINNPELYRDFIDRWLTTIDGHIVDIINGGGIHPGPTPPTPINELLLAEWNFTQDTDYLVDKVGGVVATATSSIIHDSNGLYFPTTPNGMLEFPELAYILFYKNNNFRLEVDFGNMNMTLTPNQQVRFVNVASAGFIFKNESSPYNCWNFYNGSSWYYPDDKNNDVNYFSNKTAKIYHANNNLILEDAYDRDVTFNNNVMQGRTLRIGSTTSSLFDTYIKGLRVYAKNN